jgi:sugar phosphate isomerase/epimerase
MYVACSTLCFAAEPLDEALRHIREMNFAKADITVSEAGPHLKPSDLAADNGKIGQRLKASNVPIAAFHAEFKEPDGEATRHQLRGVCRLARQLAVPLVSTCAAPVGSDVDKEASRLKEWVRIADAEGVMLTVETNSHTLTADPAVAAELCKRVPGLGLTLDPSHYVASPAGPKDYDSLFQFVKHVRLRDTGAKPECFQMRVGQGELEYGRIISQLDRFDYDRALSVDVRKFPNQDYPVEPEVRKLKYLLESLV